MHHLITSHHNPKIKSLLALEKPRERRKQGLFIIEGKREIRLALEAGYKIGNLFFCPEMIHTSELNTLLEEDKLLIPVSKDVFDKIAIRENSGGVIAVATCKTHRLEELNLSSNPLILILEAVEKPGNLGAILRMCDAAGLDAVMVCDPSTDIYNPNVIRSSIGCVFTNQLALTTTGEAIPWLEKKKIGIVSTYLNTDAIPYDAVNYTTPKAIVLGTEATGLSDRWTDHSQSNVIIPMCGKIDSMNVSTAAAVIVFEAKRQRGFNTNSGK